MGRGTRVALNLPPTTNLSVKPLDMRAGQEENLP